jgi:hypothetical protein
VCSSSILDCFADPPARHRRGPRGRAAADRAAAAEGPVPAAPLGLRPRPAAASDGRVRIALRCEHGCRGTLRLVQQRAGRRERLVGEAAYRARAGAGLGARQARPVRAAARRLPRRLARERDRVCVAHTRETSGRAGSAPTGFVSGSPCRRTGGPPFAKARRGPRP